MDKHRFIVPNWQVNKRVRAASTTRTGGNSSGVFSSFNLGHHVGDNDNAVASNRQLLSQLLELKTTPVWLNQVHGDHVVTLDEVTDQLLTADAAMTRQPHLPLVIMTADCLPVLLTDKMGTVIAAVHCGWRSLAQRILTQTLKQMAVENRDVIAWLGPCISAAAFEVGDDVRQAFVDFDPQHANAFSAHGVDKYWADLQLLTRQQLQANGVQQIFTEQACTYLQANRFFSYRRDGQTGRMATLVWLSE